MPRKCQVILFRNGSLSQILLFSFSRRHDQAFGEYLWTHGIVLLIQNLFGVEILSVFSYVIHPFGSINVIIV